MKHRPSRFQLLAVFRESPDHAQIAHRLPQTTRYDVKTINFDLWCQEQAGLPADRCDKRTAQDEAAFESYRSKVEAYEVPYLQQKNNAARLDLDILRNDPVDHPPVKDTASQRPDLNSPSSAIPPRP